MKLRLLAALFLAAVPFAQQALACGEKFLIVGRGARFQRAYVALHPASMVLLNSRLTGRRDLQSRLKTAGHRIQLVSDISELGEAVRKQSYDLVLADGNDAAQIEEVLSSVQARPLFLPVIDGSSKSAETQYKCPLKHEGVAKSRDFLATIDAVMEAKRNAKPIDCGTTQ